MPIAGSSRLMHKAGRADGAIGPRPDEGAGPAGQASVGPVIGPVAGRRRSWWRSSTWSLRTRLLAAVISLTAVVCATVGLVSVLQMRSYLQGRLDDDVFDAAARTSRALQAPPGQATQYFGPGQVPGTVIGLIQNGRITAAVVLTKGGDTGQVQEKVGSATPLSTVPADHRIHTRNLGPGLGDYELIATPLSNGTTAVTGLPTSGVDATVLRLSIVIVAMALAGLTLVTVAGAAIIRLALRPLRRVAATAAQVSAIPLDRGEVALAVRVPDAHTDPRTEVGQVGAALNSMLGHVAGALTARQNSETRVRQFVADASHELRTPLAAIRGYAELGRRGDPEQTTHALARVETQAIRMTGLVEDLLLLASFDSGRSVAVEPVDLSILLVEAIGDARAAGPDHLWRLEVPEYSINVPGEAARLTQVMLNLLANARSHTPAGTTVTAALATTLEHAVITVSDNGPGIPAQLLPEVFERFARGDSSRSRAAGSTGLGLSIVKAVVAAHHGTIEVHSRPGDTVFTVRLPRRRPEPVHS